MKDLKFQFKILFVVSALMLSVSCAKKKKVSLETPLAKESYKKGHTVGKNLKDQGYEIDVMAFSQAVKDVYNNQPLQMTEEEMTEAKQKLEDMRREQDQAQAKENKAKGLAFLEEHKRKKGVHVMKDSGIQYIILKEGNGKKPQKDDYVTINYVAKLVNGKEIKNTYKEGAPTKMPFILLISGWREVLPLMSEGSKWEVVIPYEFGYGEQGNPVIPGYSVLVTELELVKTEPQ